MTETVERVDVLIAGGGYVGLSAALAIAASVPGAKVALVDPRPWREASGDGRAFAVAAAGRRMLGALQAGRWDDARAELLASKWAAQVQPARVQTLARQILTGE